ncbi:type 1 periplasmic binding fold superfamily protein [Nonlabens xiamenensis]|uniref:type 1 periplasmic binding fold superfamily protein n=1 Tax=Nonlabens xiamenensis TaxID=2341043 RepID=UPI000F60A1BD|nr:type 1 periplasmic binding fold superfamily protein [Nonlabens xiamenensis]
MKKNIFKLAMIFVGAISLTACGDDDNPMVINEEEVITTVEYTLTNTADANDVVVLRSIDADGEGPNDPIQTVSGDLTANADYEGSIRFLNETENPAENITEEVRDEADEHEVFYITNLSSLQITKTDTDDNNNPLGLFTDVTTGAAGMGNLTIVLRHEPNKPNDNTLAGAGGETDVQVVFEVAIQ